MKHFFITCSFFSFIIAAQMHAMDTKTYLEQLNKRISELEMQVTAAHTDPQPTNPFRQPDEIEKALQELRELYRQRDDVKFLPTSSERRSLEQRPKWEFGQQQFDETAKLLDSVPEKRYLEDRPKSQIQVTEIPIHSSNSNNSQRSLASCILGWLCCSCNQE